MEKENENVSFLANEEITEERDCLINYISRCSSLYGDKLLDFMQENNLPNLQEATVAQLKKYIATHNLKPVALPKERMGEKKVKFVTKYFRPAINKSESELTR